MKRAVVAAAVGGVVLASLLKRRGRRPAPRPVRLSGLVDFAAILVDVDGTLIDSNAAHADAWARALQEHGISCDVATVRPLIGMGSDKFLPRAAGVSHDSPTGRSIAERKKALFDTQLPQLRPTRGARALLASLESAGKELVVATSADDREMDALLRQAGVADLIPRRTSKDDAGSSKPDPDIVQAALQRARCGAREAVMVGDTPYDIEAARRAGVSVIALRCGGYWSDRDLAEADLILDDPAALLDYWRR
jgi:HAD superfamily hydrolase (TIGR01509 family)